MEQNLIYFVIGSFIIYFVIQKIIMRKIPIKGIDKELQDILTKKEHKVKGRFE